MMRKVRFGIIGAGQIAHYVAWVFQDDRRVQPVAVADVNRAAAEDLATKLGAVSVYDDYRHILDRADVDAVYVATPPFLHRPIILEAITADKSVLCEKPFALNLAEVRTILTAAATKPSLKVGCCSSRFHEAASARRARQMVASGALGQVYRLWFEAVSAAPPPDFHLPQWRNDPGKNGGGIAYDWGVYDLDWISYVLADTIQPHTLFGTLDNYFALTADRPTPTPAVDGRLAAEIRCDRGLSIHWERRAAEHGPARHRVEIRGIRGGIDLMMTPATDSSPPLVRHAYVGLADLMTEVLPSEPVSWRDTLVYPIRDFAAAIVEDRQPASPPQRQVFIHAVLDALYASARSGASVLVDSS